MKKKIDELTEINKNSESLILDKIKQISSLEKIHDELRSRQNMLEHNNHFVVDIISAEPVLNEKVKEFKKLLYDEYIDFADKNDALAEEASAFKKLQEVERQLELIGRDPDLIGKNVVAIAGSFSSGKSSFLNSFFKKRDVILPIGMDPTTAIASYVTEGKSPEIKGYTWRGGVLSVSPENFKTINHSLVNDNQLNLKPLIDHFMFKNEFEVPLPFLCFIDTPGVNPGRDAKEDEAVAYDSIIVSDALLWCFDVSSGTIKDDEIDILIEILDRKPEISIYFIANKSDLKSDEENESVIDSVKDLLDCSGIKYEGITLYSSNKKFSQQKEAEEIYKFLKTYTCKKINSEKELSDNIREVFNQYIKACESRIEENKRLRKNLENISNVYNDKIDSLQLNIEVLKSRQDVRFGKSIFEKGDDEESDKKLQELEDSIYDIKKQLRHTIQRDEEDIEKARTLKKKMQQCISDVFKTASCHRESTDLHHFKPERRMSHSSSHHRVIEKDIKEAMSRTEASEKNTLPERDVDKPFLMPIEDIFSIQGRGTVVTGRVERGTLHLNDELEIVGTIETQKTRHVFNNMTGNLEIVGTKEIKEIQKTVCIGIEMFNKLLDEAQAGDNVGVLLRGIDKKDVRRGQVLAKPGTITPHKKF